MLRLYSENGRWATKNNEMIFKYTVFLTKKDDMKLYHLIDENGNDLKVKVEDYLVDD